jgi:hypothetical protein
VFAIVSALPSIAGRCFVIQLGSILTNVVLSFWMSLVL